jgi:hypothetical protein
MFNGRYAPAFMLGPIRIIKTLHFFRIDHASAFQLGKGVRIDTPVQMLVRQFIDFKEGH